MKTKQDLLVLLSPERQERYRLRRLEDLNVCWLALKESDFKILVDVAHRLKGSAESFGYQELGFLAMELEKASLLKDATLVQGLLLKFAELIKCGILPCG